MEIDVPLLIFLLAKFLSRSSSLTRYHAEALSQLSELPHVLHIRRSVPIRWVTQLKSTDMLGTSGERFERCSQAHEGDSLLAAPKFLTFEIGLINWIIEAGESCVRIFEPPFDGIWAHKKWACEGRFDGRNNIPSMAFRLSNKGCL